MKSTSHVRIRRVVRTGSAKKNVQRSQRRQIKAKEQQAFRAKFGPRGVIRSKASDKDDPTVDPHFGRVGKQTIEDTGPKKRKVTIDDETTAAAVDFIKRQVTANTPFFVWMNPTRMQFRTHVRPSMRQNSGPPADHEGLELYGAALPAAAGNSERYVEISCCGGGELAGTARCSASASSLQS